MPDRWIDEHVGDESRPRAGFEDALARDLHRAWSGAPRRSWLRAGLAAAAVIALVVGVAALLSRDDDAQIVAAPSSSSEVLDTIVDASTSVPTSTTVSPTTALPTATTVAPLVPGTPAAIVSDYLKYLEAGQWMDASQLLWEGGLEPEARADIRPLFSAPYGLVPGQVSHEALAAALEKWCQRSVCASESLQVADAEFGRVVATFDDGGTSRSSTFVGYTFEGQPGVYGLPLQAPPADQWVACPVDHVMRTMWADVDGDGWWEQLVVQTIDENGTNVVTVCGTQTQVAPLEITDGEGVWIYAINPDQQGPDDLLIGSVPPFVSGHIYSLGDGVLNDTGAPFGFIGLTGQPGESTGCGDVDGDGQDEIVNYDWQFVGGTDVSNSTSFTYSMSDAFDEGVATEQRTIALPAGGEEAVQLITGYCHGLPVATQSN